MILDLAKTLIKDSLEDVKVANHLERQRHIQKYLDYYEGENIDKYIIERFQPDAFQEVPPLSLNFTHRFINKMARVYRTGAKRNVSDQYSEMTKFKNIKLKHIERMAKLIGSVAVHITYDPMKNMFDYNPIYYYHPFMESEIKDPFAISYPIQPPTDDATYLQEMDYIYYDDENFIEYNSDGNIMDQGQHDLGILPFTFIHREHQIDSHFVAGAMDIIRANENVNILFTELCLGSRFQAFAQPFVTGVFSDTNLKRMGTDEMLVLPDGATFDYASPRPDMRSMIEVIKTIIETAAANNHLHVDFNRSGGEVPSALSLIVRDLERKEDYYDYVDLWTMYEQQIYEIEKRIAAANGINLPENLNIDFEEPSYPKTTQDEIMMNTFMLDNNLISYSELLRSYNKDLTPEQAKNLINSYIQENQEFKGQLNEQGQGQSIIQRLRQRATGTE